MSSPVEISLAELQLATRNHGTPLEALSEAVTPVGLHYLLVHYDIPAVDCERWRLHVDGHVRRELELSLEEIRARPVLRERVTIECAGNGRALLAPRPVSQPWLVEAVGTADWAGPPLRQLLDEAGVRPGAVEVQFTGLDRGVEGGVEQSYARSLPLAEALREEVILAHQMGGRPLARQHGFPLRLVVPGWYGMASVKWLSRVTVLDRPFAGYQQRHSYRLRQRADEDGEPVNRMLPRALMVPPGIPDFISRERIVELRPCRLHGRAWSGWAPVTAVEVSADGGASWRPADVQPQATPWAWTSWCYVWRPAAAGRYELCCRARDAAGNEQPLIHAGTSAATRTTPCSGSP